MDFVFDMPLIVVGPGIVVLLVGFGLGGLAVFRRYQLPKLRFGHSDAHFSGAMVGSIMVFYGLALALTAVHVWETYEDVEKVITREAACLAILWRDVAATAASLAGLHPGDGARWARFVTPFLRGFDGVRAAQVRTWTPAQRQEAAATVDQLLALVRKKLEDSTHPAQALERGAALVRASMGELKEVSVLLQIAFVVVVAIFLRDKIDAMKASVPASPSMLSSRLNALVMPTSQSSPITTASTSFETISTERPVASAIAAAPNWTASFIAAGIE